MSSLPLLSRGLRLASAAALLLCPEPAGQPWRVLGPSEAGEVWLQPVVQPFFSFRIVVGAMPEKGVLLCRPEFVQKELSPSVKVNVLQLECENNVKLELAGVDVGQNSRK